MIQKNEAVLTNSENTNALITSVMKSLGYKIDKGACAGLVKMGIRAFFNGTVTNYNACCNFILDHISSENPNYFIDFKAEIAREAQKFKKLNIEFLRTRQFFIPQHHAA